MTNYVDVGLGEVQLLADVRQIRGDLSVERDLGLALLVARKGGLIEVLQERMQHRLQLSRGFSHGGDDVAGLSRRFAGRRRRTRSESSQPRWGFRADLAGARPHPQRWMLRRDREAMRATKFLGQNLSSDYQPS